MVLYGMRVLPLVFPDGLAQLLVQHMLLPLLRIQCLHYDHVTSFASLLQQSARRCSIFGGRNDFDDLAAERNYRYQC